jgi:hypothetical protein
MAANETSHTCGTKKITYPTGSTFVCVCPPSGKCAWTVILVDGTVFSGTDLVSAPNPKPPHVTVSGSLAAIALGLQRLSKRKFIVPAKLSKQKVKTLTLRGTPLAAAAELGLELAPQRR